MFEWIMTSAIRLGIEVSVLAIAWAIPLVIVLIIIEILDM